MSTTPAAPISSAPSRRDYSKGVIYKITCRNPSIRETYIGATTNLTKRIYRHRGASAAPPYSIINSFIYSHGGWLNWDIIAIEQCAAATKAQLQARAQHYIDQLTAPLACTRSVRGPPAPKLITCECGGTYAAGSKVQHKYAQEHLRYISRRAAIAFREHDREGRMELQQAAADPNHPLAGLVARPSHF